MLIQVILWNNDTDANQAAFLSKILECISAVQTTVLKRHLWVYVRNDIFMANNNHYELFLIMLDYRLYSTL